MSNSMHRAIAAGLAVLFCGFISTRSVCAQYVDSPQYQTWAKYKVETSATYSTQMYGGPVQMAQTTTFTLKEVTPERATVQIDTKMNTGDMTRQAPPQTVSFPAKVLTGQEYLPAEMHGTIKETGKETIEAGGKKYDCRVFEYSGQSTAGRGGAPADVTGKILRNEEIPGGLAKMQMDVPTGQMIVNMVTTLVSIDAK